MRRVSLEEHERIIIFMPNEARLKIFWKKKINKGPKIHYFLLNCTLGPPNCTVGPPNLEVRGARAPGAPLDPLVGITSISEKL